MTWDLIAQDWDRYREPILERWVRLTEAEIEQVDGDQNALASRIAERYEIDVETASTEIDEWCARLDESSVP